MNSLLPGEASMRMVMTILEAHVESDQWPTLEREFQTAVHQLDAGIVQTFLLHGFADSTLWQIATLWESREALNAMRQSGQTPRGVLMFRAAQAEPMLSIFEVTAQSS